VTSGQLPVSQALWLGAGLALLAFGLENAAVWGVAAFILNFVPYIGSVMTAAAQNAGMFIAGHIIQGLCTSLLLIAAVPPLAIGYPAWAVVAGVALPIPLAWLAARLVQKGLASTR